MRAPEPPSPYAALPAVDRLLESPGGRELTSRWGRLLAADACRAALDDARRAIADGAPAAAPDALLRGAEARLSASGGRGPRPLFNLTGTVLHTNLGRALLPEAALEAMVAVGRAPCDLEFDLAEGRRGDRDAHVEALLCALTGAEAAAVVNNNAAAVVLVLNSFALGREVPVSRGELVEIGGSFRVPELMTRAGARLVEVGTTNRTHLRDYADAIGPETGLVMKVHPSNYAIEGYTHEVGIAELAGLTRERGVPLVWDLGSGSLADLSRHGLPREPMPGEALAAGADLVTFSGDKLLGGPQAGIVVGRREAVDALRRNPLRRALRVDKFTLAALAAVLRAWSEPERAVRELPTPALLLRPRAEIRAVAERVAPHLASALGAAWRVEVIECASQIGSGALPVEQLPSAGLAVTPTAAQGRGRALAGLHDRLRALPRPVVGRVTEDRLLLDLRTLREEEAFLAQLPELAPS
jgi:L-seryl-tRNA(Ser) seleniumtransferase